MHIDIFESVLDLKDRTKTEIIDELSRLGVKQIGVVEKVPGKIGTTLKMMSETGKVYYVGISSYGFLEIIREDSVWGKIVYMPIDD